MDDIVYIFGEVNMPNKKDGYSLSLIRKIEIRVDEEKSSPEMKKSWKQIRSIDGIIFKTLNDIRSFMWVAEVRKSDSLSRVKLAEQLFGIDLQNKFDSSKSIKDGASLLYRIMVELFKKYNKDETVSLSNIAVAIANRAMTDFKKLRKDGLFKGLASASSYREHQPIPLQKQTQLKNLQKTPEGELTFTWKGVNFISVGLKKDKNNSSYVDKVIENRDRLSDSSFQIDRKHPTKLFLNLCIKEKKQDYYLDGNTIIGIDLGIKNPIVIACNNKFGFTHIGSRDNVMGKLNKYKEKHRLTQRKMVIKGGKGRRAIDKGLQPFSDKRANIAKDINHNLSKYVVKQALKLNAATIQMEDLSGISKRLKWLNDWPYFDLQTKIAYKAEKEGIEVKKVVAANTSITCPWCGEINKDNRKVRDWFQCVNPLCSKYNKRLDADGVAALNIANSTNYV